MGYDKLGMLPAVQFRAAVRVRDRLSEADQRLVALIEQLDQRKAELETLEVTTPLVLPANNNRIAAASIGVEQGKNEESESEDEDLITREQIKKASQSLIDSKTMKKS